MKTIEVIEIATEKQKIAVYAPNRKGNLQFSVDGKFYTDKQFDKLFYIVYPNDHTYENGENVSPSN